MIFLTRIKTPVLYPPHQKKEKPLHARHSTLLNFWNHSFINQSLSRLYFHLHFSWQRKSFNSDSFVHLIFCYSFNVQFLHFFPHDSLFWLFTFYNIGFLMAMYPLSRANPSRFFFTIENGTGYCREELISPVNFGAVFFLISFALNNQE